MKQITNLLLLVLTVATFWSCSSDSTTDSSIGISIDFSGHSQSFGYFGYIAPNGTSTEQSFTISGTGLSSPIALTAPTGFEISKTSGSGFASSLSLALTDGNVASNNIFVRFKPTNAIAYGGNISCVSGS